MSDTLMVAIIGFLGTLCGTYFANRKSTALVLYRIELLEGKVNKHNRLIERTYELEKHSELLDEQMKVANHRITDLEGFHRHE